MSSEARRDGTGRGCAAPPKRPDNPPSPKIDGAGQLAPSSSPRRATQNAPIPASLEIAVYRLPGTLSWKLSGADSVRPRRPVAHVSPRVTARPNDFRHTLDDELVETEIAAPDGFWQCQTLHTSALVHPSQGNRRAERRKRSATLCILAAPAVRLGALLRRQRNRGMAIDQFVL